MFNKIDKKQKQTSKSVQVEQNLCYDHSHIENHQDTEHGLYRLALKLRQQFFTTAVLIFKSNSGVFIKIL